MFLRECRVKRLSLTLGSKVEAAMVSLVRRQTTGRVDQGEGEPRRGAKGQRTRERIKRAVESLLTGLEAKDIGVQDICDAADITHGGFYFHFESKEAALAEVAKDWIVQFKTKVLETPAEDDFFAELNGMLLAYVTGYVAAIGITRAVYHLDPLLPEIREVWTVHQKAWWSRLEARFRKARRELGLPTGLERWMAHALTTSIDGLCVDVYLVGLSELTRDGVEPQAVAERAALFWYRTVLGRDPDRARLNHIGPI